jgi:hypothetical protein
MTTAKKRPRRANQSLSNDRGVKAQKIIYWTAARLQKLLLRLIKKDRQEWFAARVRNRNDHQPHAKRPRRASLQSQIETNR